MPTYGYECLGCARSFETIQKITDDTLTQCDECGGVLKKKVFPVGIVFKGTGFYVNDYAKKTDSGGRRIDPAPTESKAAEPAPETPSAPAPADSNGTAAKSTETTPAAPAAAAASTPSPAVK
jgi:putative FmdB family regulatory protein